jgi:hypothetical protein
MKLLFCSDCHDIKGLVKQEWRTCMCGKSGGQYNKDGLTATIGGAARVFGIGNPFFNDLYPFLESVGKKKMQQAFYGHTDGDAWWGEYDGDEQIFRIRDSKGPALKLSVREMEDERLMVISVTDKRVWSLAGGKKPESILLPRYPGAEFDGYNQKKRKGKK